MFTFKENNYILKYNLSLGKYNIELSRKYRDDD